MSIVIVDYGSGNLHSVAKAFERSVQDTRLHMSVQLSAAPEDILRAERIVLPGVGAFADCKAGLEALPGMIEALESRVLQDGTPFLGICVGMQLLASEGHEHGRTEGLNWIAGKIVPVKPSDPALKIPHMGWNNLDITHTHPLLNHFKTDKAESGTQGTDVYFVHSYHFALDDKAHLLATTHYGDEITAAVAKDNIVGVQFHPEKSQRAGLELIRNFLTWKP